MKLYMSIQYKYNFNKFQPKTVERLSATVTWVDKFHDVITEKLAFVDKFIEKVVPVRIPR